MTDVSTQQTGSSVTKEISVTTAIVIDENVLGISFGPIEGHDVMNPTCGNCGQYNALGVAFGLIAKGVDGKICEACGERSGQYGVSLARLVEGLEELHSALTFSAPADLPVLLKIMHEALGWLVTEYAGDVAQPTPAQLGALADALDKYGVKTVGELPDMAVADIFHGNGVAREPDDPTGALADIHAEADVVPGKPSSPIA